MFALEFCRIFAYSLSVAKGALNDYFKKSTDKGETLKAFCIFAFRFQRYRRL